MSFIIYSNCQLTFKIAFSFPKLIIHKNLHQPIYRLYGITYTNKPVIPAAKIELTNISFKTDISVPIEAFPEITSLKPSFTHKLITWPPTTKETTSGMYKEKRYILSMSVRIITKAAIAKSTSRNIDIIIRPLSFMPSVFQLRPRIPRVVVQFPGPTFTPLRNMTHS